MWEGVINSWLIKMREKYYFCFRFNSISLLSDNPFQLGTLTNFQLRITKNNKLVGHTHDIPCDPDPQGLIVLKDHVIRFTLQYKQGDLLRNPCSIVLLEMIPGGQRLMGGYQFLLDNYVQARKQLHRSCMEMRVQIDENLILDYVVYIESTPQALNTMVREHQTAKRMHMLIEDDNQSFDFLPQELHHPPPQEQSSSDFDLQSPLIIRQKFWSPVRRRSQNFTGSELKPSEMDGKQTSHSANKDDKKSAGLMKMKKVTSNFSDNTSNMMGLKKIFAKKKRKLSDLMEKQVQDLAEHEDPNKNTNQLYEVICSDSKVTVSPVSSDIQEDHHNHRLSPLGSEQTPKQVPSPGSSITLGYQHWTMAIIIFILLVMLLANSFQSSKRGRGREKTSKMPRKHSKRKA